MRLQRNAPTVTILVVGFLASKAVCPRTSALTAEMTMGIEIRIRTTPSQSSTTRGRGAVGSANSAASPTRKTTAYRTGAGAITLALSVASLADKVAISRSNEYGLIRRAAAW